MLVQELFDREVQIRRWQAEQHAILAEIANRGVFAEFGYPNLETLLSDVVQTSRREGRARVKRAMACYPTVGVGGCRIPPVAPQAAEAAAAGEIGTEQLDDIIAILGEVPGEIPDAERAGYEHALVALARVAEPWRVRKAGRHLLMRLDPDGLRPPEDTPAKPKRELRWHRLRNGRLRFAGELDAEAAELLLTALSPLTAPRPSQDGERDPRPTSQRNGDALVDLVRLALRAGELPQEGGERPNVLVTINLGDLRHGDTNRTGNTRTGNTRTGDANSTGGAKRTSSTGEGAGHVTTPQPADPTADPTAESDSAKPGTASADKAPAGAGADLGYGADRDDPVLAAAPTLNGMPIDVETARRYACDCGVIPAVLGSRGAVLDLGDKKRVVNTALRRALVLRDKGCVKCGKPPTWCESHHGVHWVDGGETNLANCCLLCEGCHRLVHHAGWHITITDNTPEVHPPPWIPLRI